MGLVVVDPLRRQIAVFPTVSLVVRQAVPARLTRGTGADSEPLRCYEVGVMYWSCALFAYCCLYGAALLAKYSSIRCVRALVLFVEIDLFEVRAPGARRVHPLVVVDRDKLVVQYCDCLSNATCLAQSAVLAVVVNTFFLIE